VRPSKRLFDVVVSSAVLGASLPILAAAAAAVATDGGPVLFRQERVGRKGRRFRMLKLRTMHHGNAGPAITVGGDGRITKVGRWLRKTKIDELPQLWNVLRGDMSLVGPRPEVPEYVALYDEAQRQVLDLVPGVTDPASIRYRNESEILRRAEDPEAYYRSVVLPEKLRLSLEYGKNATFASDLAVLFRTALAVLGTGDDTACAASSDTSVSRTRKASSSTA
jgi:lipopolysaccharide/colanic/teichoic acid biosynthesis glycosyltransferase